MQGNPGVPGPSHPKDTLSVQKTISDFGDDDKILRGERIYPGIILIHGEEVISMKSPPDNTSPEAPSLPCSFNRSQ